MFPLVGEEGKGGVKGFRGIRLATNTKQVEYSCILATNTKQVEYSCITFISVSFENRRCAAFIMRRCYVCRKLDQLRMTNYELRKGIS